MCLCFYSNARARAIDYKRKHLTKSCQTNRLGSLSGRKSASLLVTWRRNKNNIKYAGLVRNNNKTFRQKNNKILDNTTKTFGQKNHKILDNTTTFGQYNNKTLGQYNEEKTPTTGGKNLSACSQSTSFCLLISEIVATVATPSVQT